MDARSFNNSENNKRKIIDVVSLNHFVLSLCGCVRSPPLLSFSLSRSARAIYLAGSTSPAFPLTLSLVLRRRDRWNSTHCMRPSFAASFRPCSANAIFPFRTCTPSQRGGERKREERAIIFERMIFARVTFNARLNRADIPVHLALEPSARGLGNENFTTKNHDYFKTKIIWAFLFTLFL